MEKEYLSCADTAKLVRQTLKRAFPGQKFGVRSSTYSMGASISVHYTGGPASADVEALVCCYESSHFDGSIDMAFSHSSWLEPDGGACIAHSPGSVGSMGLFQPVYNDRPSLTSRLVSFGADSIHVSREPSQVELIQAEAWMKVQGYDYWLPETIWRLAWGHFDRGFDFEDVLTREYGFGFGRKVPA